MAAFNSMAGGQGDAIQMAMARRGMGVPATMQVGPSAPQYNPSLQQQAVPTPSASQPIQSPQAGESKMILGALKNRLELLGQMGQ